MGFHGCIMLGVFPEVGRVPGATSAPTNSSVDADFHHTQVLPVFPFATPRWSSSPRYVGTLRKDRSASSHGRTWRCTPKNNSYHCQQSSLLPASSMRRRCLFATRLRNADVPSSPAANFHDDAFGDSGPAQVAGSGAAQIMEQQTGHTRSFRCLGPGIPKIPYGLPSERVKTASSGDFPATHCANRLWTAMIIVTSSPSLVLRSTGLQADRTLIDIHLFHLKVYQLVESFEDAVVRNGLVDHWADLRARVDTSQ